MSSRILSVPQARLDALLADYRREVARRCRQSLLVLAILAILIVMAGYAGEVDLTNLVDNISNFTSYFSRIMPKPRSSSSWTATIRSTGSLKKSRRPTTGPPDSFMYERGFASTTR